MDRIRLGFSETIDSSSFTLADVVLLEGPAGTIAPLAASALGTTEFEVVFAPQSVPGEYRLVTWQKAARFKEQDIAVRVEAGKGTTINLEMSRK